MSFRFSIFPERGAVGKMLGGSLQSVAALLVCMAASPEDERVGIFALQPSEFPRATGGGLGFRYISTLGNLSFSMHTSGSERGTG